MNLNQTKNTLDLWGFIKNHWYFILTIILLIPQIITLIHNPVEGLINIGESLLSSDNRINKDIILLQTDTTQLIGMSYPSSGHYNLFVYYLRFFYFVIFDIIKNIWLLFFPLIIIYSIVSFFRMESTASNLLISSVVFLIYLLVINCILLFVDNSLVVPQDISKFQQTMFVVKNIIPFHGTFNLIIYIISKLR